MNEILEHIQRPHIRRIHPIPGKDPNGRPIVQLRDPFMSLDRMLGGPFRPCRPFSNSTATHLQEIADSIKRNLSDETLAKNMDEAGLPWGPRSEELLIEQERTHGAPPHETQLVLGQTNRSSYETQGVDALMEDPRSAA